jgi:hypothetical protein
MMRLVIHKSAEPPKFRPLIPEVAWKDICLIHDRFIRRLRISLFHESEKVRYCYVHVTRNFVL